LWLGCRWVGRVYPDESHGGGDKPLGCYLVGGDMMWGGIEVVGSSDIA